MELAIAYVCASAAHGLFRAHNAMESIWGNFEIIQAAPADVDPFDIMGDDLEPTRNTTLIRTPEKFEVFSTKVTPLRVGPCDFTQIKDYNAQLKIAQRVGLSRIHPYDYALNVNTFKYHGLVWTDNRFVISPHRTTAYMYSAFRRRAPFTLTIASIAMYGYWCKTPRDT